MTRTGLVEEDAAFCVFISPKEMYPSSKATRVCVYTFAYLITALNGNVFFVIRILNARHTRLQKDVPWLRCNPLELCMFDSLDTAYVCECVMFMMDFRWRLCGFRTCVCVCGFSTQRVKWQLFATPAQVEKIVE